MSRRGKSHIGRMALWVREQGARAEAADHCEGGAGSRGTWGRSQNQEVRANLSSPDNAGKSQCFEVDVAMAARAGSCRAEAAGLAPRTAMAAQAVRLRGRFPETTQRVARGRRHFFPQLSRTNVPFRCVPRAARWCCVRKRIWRRLRIFALSRRILFGLDDWRGARRRTTPPRQLRLERR